LGRVCTSSFGERSVRSTDRLCAQVLLEILTDAVAVVTGSSRALFDDVMRRHLLAMDVAGPSGCINKFEREPGGFRELGESLVVSSGRRVATSRNSLWNRRSGCSFRLLRGSSKRNTQSIEIGS